jgi:hypothetical protein
MWEFLAVVLIYTILSFAGMAVLWTVAAKKGLLQAPTFFFWMPEVPKSRAADDESLSGRPDFACNRAMPTMAFIAMSYTSNVHAPVQGFSSEDDPMNPNPNQVAESEAITCSV